MINKDKRITIRVSNEEREILEKNAVEMHLSVSSYIRYALLTFINEQSKNDKE